MTLELRHEYLAFANSIKSKSTLKSYNYDLKNYMRYLKVSDISTLLKGDNKTIEQQIISYLVAMRNQSPPVGYALRHRRLAGIKKFMEMNDVILNWKKVNQYLGARQKAGKDRGYTTDEIQRLLSTCTDERMRVVILLLASTGMRVGAIPSLKLKHFFHKEINQNTATYKITVYENEAEEYFTFCTPECRTAIDDYLKFRERSGEKLTRDSPLIREQFNAKYGLKIRQPRFISFDTITTNLYTAINKSGIQTRVALTESKGQGRERKEVQRANGFRKFAITKMAEAEIDYEIRERLVGHTIGMPGHYLRFGEQKYLEEYLKAVNLLTINEENRLRIKVQEMQTYHSKELDSIAKKIQMLEEKFGNKN